MIGRTAALGIALWLGALVGSTDPACAQDGARGRDEADAPDAEEADTPEEDVDAESEIVEEEGEKVKVFRFSGLDISGELKSPQLLYFLNRLRAEFDRPRLPHRSFVPELIESTRGEAF